ncbi:MAG TPA: alpha/beta hydrolase [Kribbella sp.]|nr:alpha/beta hydrolase [Kribbella sp.]
MTLHHVAHGEGVPVLALHGWSPDHRLMTGCLEPVFSNRPGYRRLYPDLPGMGQSPAGSIDSSDGIVAALLRFIDEEIGDEPFLLIGESYGGYLARGLLAQRAEQILGLCLICSIGTELDHDRRQVPAHVVLRADPELIASLSEEEAADYTGIAVVQSPETLRHFRDDIAPGLAAADSETMQRIRKNWALSIPPETGSTYSRPTLILSGRQDSSTGFAEQFTLLPHYPRASYAVLDLAGHNLQIEQPVLFGALVNEWLDRVGHDAGQPGS